MTSSWRAELNRATQIRTPSNGNYHLRRRGTSCNTGLSEADSRDARAFTTGFIGEGDTRFVELCQGLGNDNGKLSRACGGQEIIRHKLQHTIALIIRSLFSLQSCLPIRHTVPGLEYAKQRVVASMSERSAEEQSSDL